MNTLHHLPHTLLLALTCASTLALAQPANDTCGNAQAIPAAGPFPYLTTTVDLTLATTTGDPAGTCLGGSARSVWYSFKAPSSGSWSFSLCDSVTGTTVQDTVLGVYAGSACPNASEFACNDDSCGTRSALTTTLSGGNNYFVLVSRKGSTAPAAGEGLVQLQISRPPPASANDGCAGAEVIPAAGPFPWLSSVVDVTEAGAAGDPLNTCVGNLSHSVWYRFTPAVAGAFNFSLCNPATGTTVTDTALGLYSGSACASFTQAACNDDACGGRSSVTATLAPGTTYYVVASTPGSATPAPGSSRVQLAVSNAPPAPANDACAAAPALGLNLPVSGTNLSAGNDYQLSGAACFLGAGQSPSIGSGIEVAYSFTAPAAGPYSFRLREATQDTVLYVASSCATPTSLTLDSCQSASNRNALGAEEVSCLPLMNGERVFAFADRTAGGLGTTFSLEVDACHPETEPNPLPASASAFTCGVTGRIAPAGDVDFFSLGTPAAGARLFALVDAVTSNDPDFDLRATTSSATLEFDDGDDDAPFGGNAPNLQGTPLVGGPAWLRVNHARANVQAEPYRLYAVLQGAPIDAVPEVEPNETTVQATAAASNYFRGALGGSAPSTDVDVYRFTASAGDLLLIGLDGDPLRNATPLDARLELLDDTGAVLLAVNDAASTSSTAASATLTGSSPTAPGEGLTWRARASGTYFVSVRAGSTSTTTAAGDYLLSISRNCLAGAGAPGLSSIAPASGSASGGTTVTLSGSNFVSGSTLTIGGVPARSVTVLGPFQLTAVTGPRTAGAADVVLTSPTGASATLTSGYQYAFTAPAPVVSAVTPAAGPIGGGTAVTLWGSGLAAGARVTFGGAAASDVIVVSGTYLTAVTPPGIAGVQVVEVINPDLQRGSLVVGFTYVPPPAVWTIEPSWGSVAGGTLVKVTGTGFAPGALLSVGGVPAADVVVVNESLLTATTPPGLVGAQVVEVTNLDQQRGVLPLGFTYLAPPTLNVVTPSAGLITGGTAITVSGSDFKAGASVTIGGVPANVVLVLSSTLITATTPPGVAGPCAVVVENPGELSGALPGGFTFLEPLALTALSPSWGPQGGGTSVTLTGAGFYAGTRVTFGGVPAASVTVVSEQVITATTPAGSGEGGAVVVSNPDGERVELSPGFTWVGPPEVRWVDPSTGPTTGGTWVTVRGAGFIEGASVLIGGVAARDVVVVGSTELTAYTGPHAAGVVEVLVRNTDAQSGALPDGFEYLEAATTGEQDAGAPTRLGGKTIGCSCGSVDAGAVGLLLLALLRRRR